MAAEATNFLPAGQSGGLQEFLQITYQTPTLSREEERSLFERLQKHDDVDAARKLVMANLRYVIYIARSYNGYGLPLEDLIQQGSLGLMKSIRRFDLSHEVRLVSFAVHWIKAEIHDFILRNWRIAKVATTKAQRKLFFNLRKSKQRLGWSNREEVETIAKDLGVKPAEVMEMELRLAGRDESFDPTEDDSEGESLTPSMQLSYEGQLSPEAHVEKQSIESLQHDGLKKGLAELDERSLDIVRSRFLGDEKVGLKELAERYQVSMERIRQIEVRALQKLQPYVEAM
jgi:RNA polymerase sigma-32 factor